MWTYGRAALDCVGRRTRMLVCSFWFLVLFTAGGMVLIIHLQDLSEMFPEEAPDGKLTTIQLQYRQATIAPMQLPDFEGSQDTATTAPQDPDQDSGSVQVTKRNRKLLKTTLVTQNSNKPSSSSSTSSSSSSTSFETTPILWRTDSVQMARRTLMREVCAKYKKNISRTVNPQDVWRVFAEDRYKLLYCEVPKAGCSNWKRTLIVLSGQASDIRALKHDEVHGGKYLHTLQRHSRPEILARLRSYTKLLFVREPMERLVSAYRDKLENPNDFYNYYFGRPIIGRYRPNATEEALKSGAGTTFPEFVRYLLDPHPPAGTDIHWQPASQLCQPCLLNFDFIGKFENMGEESNLLLRRVAAPGNLTMPTEKDRDPEAERTSLNLTNRYLAMVSAKERQQLYDFYYMDYLMFNYSKPFSDLY